MAWTEFSWNLLKCGSRVATSCCPCSALLWPCPPPALASQRAAMAAHALLARSPMPACPPSRLQVEPEILFSSSAHSPSPCSPSPSLFHPACDAAMAERRSNRRRVPRPPSPLHPDRVPHHIRLASLCVLRTLAGRIRAATRRFRGSAIVLAADSRERNPW